MQEFDTLRVFTVKNSQQHSAGCYRLVKFVRFMAKNPGVVLAEAIPGRNAQ
jgi:hypothetical protein